MEPSKILSGLVDLVSDNANNFVQVGQNQLLLLSSFERNTKQIQGERDRQEIRENTKEIHDVRWKDFKIFVLHGQFDNSVKTFHVQKGRENYCATWKKGL